MLGAWPAAQAGTHWNRRWQCLCRRGTWLCLLPGAKPDDVDIGAQDSSGQISDLLRNLSRSSHEFLVEHVPSVAVLTTMSTKLAWNEGQFEVTRTGPHVFVLFKEFLNTLFDGQLKPEQAYVQSVEEAEREKPR